MPSSGPIAKLIFDLSDPDQAMEHLRCVKSADLAATLWDIRNILYSDQTAQAKVKDISELFEDLPLDSYIR